MTETAVFQFLGAIALLVIGAVITFGVQWALAKRTDRSRALEAAATELLKLRDRLAALEADNALLKKDVQPLSVAMQSWLVEKLTHFHTPIMDALLRKLGPPSTLTEAEEKELEAALVERAATLNGRIDDAEKDAAKMLPMVIRMVKAEIQTAQPDTLQIVSTPAKAPEADEKKED